MITASVCLFPESYGVPVVDIARQVENLGFAGLFVPENTHMPLSRRQQLAYDDDRLRQLAGFYDPFVALGAAAAVTERITLGMSVCLLTHRDPLITAKAVASLDQISGGRVVLGVAGGLIAEAMENHGSPFRQRWRVVRERCQQLRTLWREDVASSDGEYASFGPSYCYPKPAQAGGPPIWIGSNSSAVPARVADYADGWIVFNGRYQGDAVADLRAACAARDRNFNELEVSLMDPDETGLAAARDQGFESVIFILRARDASEAERELERLRRLVD